MPLDDASVARPSKRSQPEVEAVAVGFLHTFTNPVHERRVGDAIARRLPDITVTLSSEVSPEMREYERFSTACANAYHPAADEQLHDPARTRSCRDGFRCPMLLMTRAAALPPIETAIRFPVRLVESGPPAARSSPRPLRGRTVSPVCHSTWAAPRRKFALSTRRSRRRRGCSKWRESIVSPRAAVCRCAFR